MMKRNPAAFTVLELMIALVIGAVVMTCVHAMVVSVDEHFARIRDVVRIADHESNGERTLRLLIARMRQHQSGLYLAGSADRLEFESRCEVPGGWMEECAVHILIDQGMVSAAFRTSVHADTLDGIVAADRFIFLVDAARGGRWQSEWRDHLLPPPAVGIIRIADTLLMRVGDRG